MNNETTQSNVQINAENHLGLVYKIAHKYALNYGNPGEFQHDDMFEEFRQIGAIGLMKAIESYDSTKGAFSTHATFYIVGEITEYFRKNGTQKRDYRVVSYLDDCVSPSGSDGGKQTALRDLIPDESCPNPQEEVERSEIANLVRRKVEGLSIRQKTIVKMHMGIDCQSMTFDEIGKAIGSSRQYAKQVYDKAIRILRLRIGKADGVPSKVSC